MSSSVEILLPSSSRFTLLVTLVSGLTVLDLKKLVVTEMVALGHGGGGTDNIRLVRRGIELFDTMLLLDVGFEKADSVMVSQVLVPPEITSVLELNSTRDFLHSPARQRRPIQGGMSGSSGGAKEDMASVGSLAMSKASTLEGGDRGGASNSPSARSSSVQEVKSEAGSGQSTMLDMGMADRGFAPESVAVSQQGKKPLYPPAPVFRSRLYEYGDFLDETVPCNGGHRVSLDGNISIRFKVGKNGMIPCAYALKDMQKWLSNVESLPTKTAARDTLSMSMEKEAAEIASEAKKARDEAKKKKKFDPFSKEPSIADRNANIEAEAMRDAAVKLANKSAKKAGSSYGDMEVYFDRDQEELSKRGFSKWTHHEYPEAALLLKASQELGHKAKYSAREANIAKKYETVGSVSIAQSQRTGGMRAGGTGEGDEDRNQIDVKLDRIRYWWRGVNDGYTQGDRHSWQRYTQSLPIPCSIEISKEGGLPVNVAQEENDMFRNQIVDAFNPSATSLAASTVLPSPGPTSDGDSTGGNDGTINVPVLPGLGSRLPTREQLGVGSFPKLDILPGGTSATGVKSRESYPLDWPTPGTANATGGESKANGERDQWDHAHDDLQSHVLLTIKPAQPLDHHTDYFLLLRNGLPVVPVGGTVAPLSAYRSAGVLCEDKIIRFRTESKGHRRNALKISAEEEQKELERANDPKRRPLEGKDLGKVDWSAVQARISGPLTSNKGTRNYLRDAQLASEAHARELQDRYEDGKLAQKIDNILDEISPQYFKAKCDKVVVP